MLRIGRKTPWIVTCALVALPGIAAVSAQAACLPGGISGGVSARLDKSLLPVLEPLIRSQIPTQFNVPNTPYTVFTCGGGFFDDTVVTPDGIVTNLALKDVELRFERGAIVMDAVVDVNLGGHVALQMCAAPDAYCAIGADVKGAKIHARVEPKVTQCAPKMPITDFTLTVDPDDTDVTLADCLYDSLWDTVYEWFSGYIVDTLSEKIGDAVKEKLPPLLESFTTGVLASGFEYRKVHIGALPSKVDVTTEGMVVTFDGDVRPIGDPPPGWCLGKGSVLPDEEDKPVPAPSGNAMVSLAMSQPMLQRAVRATWLAGGLCYASTEFEVDLSTPLDFMAPGIETTGRVAVLKAPSVTFSGEGDGAIEVGIDELRADVFMQVPGYPATTLSATTGATLAGTVAIDPRLQSVVLDLSDARTKGAIISAPGTSLAFSGTTLDSMIQTSLLPALANYRGRMALLGNLFVAAPVATRVDRVDVSDERVQADLELYPKDPTDNVPPIAALAAKPKSPSPSRFTVDLASTDDRTPERFLRHRLVVDGVEDPELRSGQRIVLSGLTDGKHRVSVYTLDLNANESATPAKFEVDVDTRPPVVTLLGAPKGVLHETTATIDVDASDTTSLRGSLKTRWILSRVVGGNKPDIVVTEGTVQRDDPIVLTDIPEDVILRLRVLVTDEAGNEGEAAASFFRNVTPTMGECTSIGTAAWPMLVVALVIRGRRRRVVPRA